MMFRVVLVLALVGIPLAGWAMSTDGGTPGVVVIRMASMAPEGSPWAKMLQDFKQLAEEKSQHRLAIRLFLGGQMGDENEAVLMVKRGQLQGASASIGALASQVPEVAVLELPFLFSSENAADRLLDGAVGNALKPHFTRRGLVFGFWSENGFRSFGGHAAVHSPADFKGRKMRSQENPIHLAFWRALGASPVPIPATEAITAIQTGVVDGYDQTPLYAFAARWYSAGSHFTVSNHIYQPAAIFFHQGTLDALPAQSRDALMQAGAAVMEPHRRQIRAMVPLALENFQKAGIKVNVLTPKERAAFEVTSQKMRQEFMRTATPEQQAVYALILQGAH